MLVVSRRTTTSSCRYCAGRLNKPPYTALPSTCPCIARKTFVRVSNASAAGMHVELGVERVDLEHVVVARAGRRRAGAAIDLARRADLEAAVGQLRAARLTFGHAGRGRRDVPDDPMRLVFRRAVTRDVEVAHVQHERLRAGRHVGPAHGGRGALAGRGAGRRLAEPHGNLAAVGEALHRQHHRRCRWRRAGGRLLRRRGQRGQEAAGDDRAGHDSHRCLLFIEVCS